MDKFHLDPSFFPESTKDFFSVDEMIQFGVVALGTKDTFWFFKRGKRLNVGVVDPKDRKSYREVVAQVKRRGPAFQAVRYYQVEPVEFVRVLERVYGVTEERVRSHPNLSPGLRSIFSSPSGESPEDTHR